MRFELTTTGRIVFGCGALPAAADEAALHGGAALVVTGRSGAGLPALAEALAARGVPFVRHVVPNEPTPDDIRRGAAAAVDAGCRSVIGLGGGSAIDAAKLIAAMATNPGEVVDHLEIVGGGRAFERPPLPCVAVPTTAGTGAEATRNAVIRVPEAGVKASARGPQLFPRLAVVDPLLTMTMPRAVTVATGLDALAQLVEAFTSSRANPAADAFCREGLKNAPTALPRAVEAPDDVAAREAMSLAALFSGIALANAGLGAVHGLAGPLGGMLGAPHGALCGAMLPRVVAANVRALREREPGSAALGRYGELAAILTGGASAAPEDAAPWLEALVERVGGLGLGALGLAPGSFEESAACGETASSMKGNPIRLDRDELVGILRDSM